MLFKINVQNEKRTLTVQEEIDMTGHQELQKNQHVSAREEEANKSYVPLRGGASRTHQINLNMGDQ